MTASLSHGHTGSCGFWIVRLVAFGLRCDRSAMFATISSGRRILRSISTHDQTITNDWRISIARAIVGNGATSGSDQRPTVRSIVTAGDRWYEQSLHPAIDRTSNRATTDPRSPTTGGATMHDWWYDNVSPICDRLRFGTAG